MIASELWVYDESLNLKAGYHLILQDDVTAKEAAGLAIWLSMKMASGREAWRIAGLLGIQRHFRQFWPTAPKPAAPVDSGEGG